MNKIISFLFAILFCTDIIAADKVKITVSNSLPFARANEMVEVDLATIKEKLDYDNAVMEKVLTPNIPGLKNIKPDPSRMPYEVVITDADDNVVPYQETYDGKLIFSAGVPAKGKAVYYAKIDEKNVFVRQVFGRQFPERVDDIAWENDRVAFRCYGPALQKSGERAWGYDIWNKRTDKLVVADRYAGELDPDIAKVCKKLRDRGENDLADDLYNAVSYHVDHGNGMDCYKVGPTLGAGTTAILENYGQDIHYPKCYTNYEILDSGPLRFTVKLIYGTENVEGQSVVETRIITLDAGSQMNKAVVSYEGLTKKMPVATGIIIHNENPSAYVLNEKAGYMGYEDLGDPNQYKEKYRAKQNKDFGQIYVGTVFEKPVDKMKFLEGKNLPGACGHVLAITDYQTGDYIYYFGTGWSRNPNTNFHSLADWEAYLSQFAQQVKSPLKVKF